MHVARSCEEPIYRHAWATGLFPKRQKNVRTALEKIIEQAGEVEVNAASVVTAVSAYARINAAGQWVERSETLNLNELLAGVARRGQGDGGTRKQSGQRPLQVMKKRR